MTKSTHIHVRPKDGLKIRDEYSLQIIPPEGATVKLTRLVHRHLRSGDLIEQPPLPENAPAKQKKGE